MTNVKLAQSATLASVIVASLLIIIKTYIWKRTQSLTVQASLMDSIFDVFSSLVNHWALRKALVPADRDHRFGHGKIEALAGFFQSLVIGASALWIFYQASFPKETIVSSADTLSFVLLISTLFLTAFLVAWQRYVIKRTTSLAVRADAVHYEGDFLINAATFLGIFLLPSWPLIDSILGSFIALYILKTSFSIGKRSLDILMDRELSDDILERIQTIARAHPFVLGLHDLRTRSAGVSDFIQLHLDLDPNISLIKAHNIAEEVEESLRQAFPHAEVLIHQDPYNEDTHDRVAL